MGMEPMIEGVSPGLVERMMALVREMSLGEQPGIACHFTEARAIAAELPVLSDPDEDEAVRIVGEWDWDGQQQQAFDVVVAAIKRGRTLATRPLSTTDDAQGAE
jgi:hypothetical protein